MQYPRAKIRSRERPVGEELLLHAQVPVLRVSLLKVRWQHKEGAGSGEKCIVGCRRKRLGVRIAARIARVRCREVARGRRQSNRVAPRRHGCVAGVVVKRRLLET